MTEDQLPLATVWTGTCKDCLRESSAEREKRLRKLAQSQGDDGQKVDANPTFSYPGRWLSRVAERGQTRSDRCAYHRAVHRKDAELLAAPYIDIDTIGLVLNPEEPSGPLGALGPLRSKHEAKEIPSGLQPERFAMKDRDVVELLEALRTKQVALVVAGTGSGKSRFLPYRLLVPPEGMQSLAEHGPIIVTEPRRQAAIENARFIADYLHRTGMGAGTDIGYRIAGDAQYDANCSLTFVTDGSLINWLRDGSFARFGAIVVDEAHERNRNIDVILGFLRQNLSRFPHLKLIIISATIDADFFREYFGGADHVHLLECEGAKQFGYAVLWPDAGIEWRAVPEHVDPKLEEHTAHYATLRLGLGEVDIARDGRTEMPKRVVQQILRLLENTDEGDILAFLPTNAMIDKACKEVEDSISASQKSRIEVLGLSRGSSKRVRERACSAAIPGDPRRVIIATNVAETSLTIDGISFVVDSGLITQSEWDVETAKGTLPTEPHSQDGLRQRWGRVGRSANGWVFPLYTKAQYESQGIFPPHTPPEATRASLEKFLLTALATGLSDVENMVWPAAYVRAGSDAPSQQRAELFKSEINRASHALIRQGAVKDGDLTPLGLEIERFSGEADQAAAMILADQLACAIEVATALALLTGHKHDVLGGLLRFDKRWNADDRNQARTRHRAMSQGCADDLELALKIFACWEAVGKNQPEGLTSASREAWCRAWGVDHQRLTQAMDSRDELLHDLLPGVKWITVRPIELVLIPRARAVLARTMGSVVYTSLETGWSSSDASMTMPVRRGLGSTPNPRKVVALQATRGTDQALYISNLVAASEWMLTDECKPLAFAERIRGEGDPNVAPNLESLDRLQEWIPGNLYEVEFVGRAEDQVARQLVPGGPTRVWTPPGEQSARDGNDQVSLALNGGSSDAQDDDSLDQAEERDDPEEAADLNDDPDEEAGGGDFAVTAEERLSLNSRPSEDDTAHVDLLELESPDDPEVGEAAPTGDKVNPPAPFSPDQTTFAEAAVEVVDYGHDSSTYGQVVVLGHSGVGARARVVVARLSKSPDIPVDGCRWVRVIEKVEGWGPPFLRLLDTESGAEYATPLTASVNNGDTILHPVGGIKASEELQAANIVRLQHLFEDQPGPIFRANATIVEVERRLKIRLDDDAPGLSLTYGGQKSLAQQVPLQIVGAPVVATLQGDNVDVRLRARPADPIPVEIAAGITFDATELALRSQPLMSVRARDAALSLSPDESWRDGVSALWQRSNALTLIALEPGPSTVQEEFNRVQAERLKTTYVGSTTPRRINNVLDDRIYFDGPENVSIVVFRERMGNDGAVVPEQHFKRDDVVDVSIDEVRTDGRIQFSGRVTKALPAWIDQVKTLFPVGTRVEGTVVDQMPQGDVRVALPHKLTGLVPRGSLTNATESFTQGNTVSVRITGVRPGNRGVWIDLAPANVAEPVRRTPPIEPRPQSPRPEPRPQPTPTVRKMPRSTRARGIAAAAVFVAAILLGLATALFIAFHYVAEWRNELWRWAWNEANWSLVTAIDTSSYQGLGWGGWSVIGVLGTLGLMLVSAVLTRPGGTARSTLLAFFKLSAVLVLVVSWAMVLFFSVDRWTSAVFRWGWERQHGALASFAGQGQYAGIDWEAWVVGGTATAALLLVAERVLRRT